MDDLDARRPRLELPQLDHEVKIRRGPFSRGRGRAQLQAGCIVVTAAGGDELLRAPVPGAEATVSLFFGDIGVRAPRRFARRNWLRLEFSDPGAPEEWRGAVGAVERWHRHATYWERARRAADSAASGGLRDRAWRRTGAAGRDHGVLQLGQGWLSFWRDGESAWSVPVDQVKSVSAPWWRSGTIVVKTPDGRQTFGFDPRRAHDGDWEKGDSGIEAPRGGPGNPPDGGDAGNALMLMAYLLFRLLEGHFIRRGRRREWLPALRGETSPQSLLDARAEFARSQWEQQAAY